MVVFRLCTAAQMHADTTETRVKPPVHSSTHKTRNQTENTPNKTLLPVALGNTLKLVLLLDGIRVGATLGGVDQLLSKALSDGLDVAESSLASTDGEESNGLVDTAEGRHIDGLATDGTGGTDTGAVFAGTAVDDGINGDLQRVLVGHDVDLSSTG